MRGQEQKFAMDLPQANLKELEIVLDYLKNRQGCDLTGYKRNTLMRRFWVRMQQLKIHSFQDYLKYLQYDSEEWPKLLNTVLINHTGFFRDPESWDYLAQVVIPGIIARKQPDEPIRVWSAGCATGEEVYSLVILWAEALGIEDCIRRVQFYATDIDEAALEQARQGIYRINLIADLSFNEQIKLNNESQIARLKGISSDWPKKYFQFHDKSYTFEPRLRRTIIFARHDLIEDAPISRVDLLVCRNVLIYFTPEYQATIFVRFHFALKDTGFLFLGKAESIINDRAIFTPISFGHRMYAKGLALNLDDYLLINPKARIRRNHEQLLQSHFWQTSFETNPMAQIAVNLDERLVGVNESAYLLFDLKRTDWSRPFEELEPGKLVGSIKEFYEQPRQINLKKVSWKTETETKYFDISLVPVYDRKKILLGAILTFMEL